MYQQYWNLRESPFRGGLDPAFFFGTAHHDEALARLHFLAEERRRLGLLTGPGGVGKSMLLEIFARQVRDAGGHVARVSLLGSDANEFLWSLAAQCGLNPTVASSPFALWRAVADQLIERRYERQQTVVLLDDADGAGDDVSDLLLRLAQFDPHPETRLTLVLAADGEQLGNLHSRLLELAELAVSLEPWNLVETAAFLDFSLQRAGRIEPIFTPAAARRLFELSGGMPLRIKQLADLALLAGAGLSLTQIDQPTIDEVCQELGSVASHGPIGVSR